MSAFAIRHELDVLNRDVARYTELSGKLPEDVMLKQGGKLASNLSARLEKFRPGKGVVTTERTAALKRGEGVYVRPLVRQSVYEKLGARTEIVGRRLIFGKGKGRGTNAKGANLQALAVKRELAVRESGGGFLGYSARAGATKFGSLPGLKPGAKKIHRDRYKRYLATAGLTSRVGAASLTFSWGEGSSRSSRIAKVLQQPRAQNEVVSAIRDTARDIRNYVPNKAKADARRAFR